MTDAQKLMDQLIQHEGVRLKPYRDSVGKLTIGVGRNLDDVGISHAEAMMLLEHDIDRCVGDLATFPWFAHLDAARQRVMLNMRFNLGPKRFRGFKAMLAAVARGDYQTVADEMLDSKWAGQVKGRAVRLAKIMRSGRDVE